MIHNLILSVFDLQLQELLRKQGSVISGECTVVLDNVLQHQKTVTVSGARRLRMLIPLHFAKVIVLKGISGKIDKKFQWIESKELGFYA